MGTQEELASFLSEMEAAGDEVSDFATFPDGVVFRVFKPARAFCDRHGKDLKSTPFGITSIEF